MSFDENNTRQQYPARYAKRTTPLELTFGGKLLPQASDLEEAVLGALMLETNALLTVGDILRPEIFYQQRHQTIYKAIFSLMSKGKPVDILTVNAELRSMGELESVGGAYYITELTNRVASAANIEYHARIIQQQYIKRRMIEVSTTAIENCYNDQVDIFELLSATELTKDDLLSTISIKKEVSNAELYQQSKQKMRNAGFSHNGITGVPSGFTDLDKITGGWQKSDLIILAARPAMGKTSLALQFATNAAIRFNFPVAVFSLEMSMEQLMHKEMAIETAVPLWKIKKSKLDPEDWSRIDSFDDVLNSAPIFWDDTAGLKVLELAAKCRRLKSQHDIQLIVIDYLQLLHGKGEGKGNREQEIGFISRTLKAIAKTLDIPVIALSQLSRALENRPGGSKRPMLSDLRESGSIEQDADMVLFLYRDEYYKIDQDELGNSTAGLAEIDIAKHRNGETSQIVVKFDKETTGFRNDEFEFTGSVQFTGSVEVIQPPENFTPFTIKPSEQFDNDNEPECPF